MTKREILQSYMHERRMARIVAKTSNSVNAYNARFDLKQATYRARLALDILRGE
jgi:hypothetical protein